MINNKYNKNSLEAVTQGKVCGEPVRSLDLFHLAKTTLFVILCVVNNSFCDDFEDTLTSLIKEFNDILPIKLQLDKSWETAEEAELRCYKEKYEAEDVELNKAEIRDGRYWINGGWIIRKNSQYERVAGGWIYKETDNIKKDYVPARKEEDLVDSDNDGYDDYTEYKHGTNPQDPREIPAIRKGNNPVTFKMEGCQTGFNFQMFNGSFKSFGIGGVAIKKENLKNLINNKNQ